jgi:hypothetical protein
MDFVRARVVVAYSGADQRVALLREGVGRGGRVGRRFSSGWLSRAGGRFIATRLGRAFRVAVLAGGSAAALAIAGEFAARLLADDLPPVLGLKGTEDRALVEDGVLFIDLNSRRR